jgi:hypothetical protein
MYGCEKWSLALLEVDRPRENRDIRRIFGLKEDEVRASWRRLHNEEPHKL